MEFDDGVCSDLFELLDLTLVEQSEHISHGFLWARRRRRPHRSPHRQTLRHRPCRWPLPPSSSFFPSFPFSVNHHSSCKLYYEICSFLCAFFNHCDFDVCVCESVATFLDFRLRQDISAVVVIVIFSGLLFILIHAQNPNCTYGRKTCGNDLM